MNVMVMDRLMSPPSRMHQKLDALPPMVINMIIHIHKIWSSNDIKILSWTTAEDEEAESEELVVAHQPTREEGELNSIHVHQINSTLSISYVGHCKIFDNLK